MTERRSCGPDDFEDWESVLVQPPQFEMEDDMSEQLNSERILSYLTKLAEFNRTKDVVDATIRRFSNAQTFMSHWMESYLKPGMHSEEATAALREFVQHAVDWPSPAQVRKDMQLCLVALDEAVDCWKALPESEQVLLQPPCRTKGHDGATPL